MRLIRAAQTCAVWMAIMMSVAHAQQQKAAFRVQDLTWISGSWSTPAGASVATEEVWTGAEGGSLLGMSKTVEGGRTVFFEYLRIEQRGDDIFYIAHPRAKSPGTEFKLVRLREGEAIFENPTHDFPKRIVYRRNADGSLTARVEGDGTEKEKAQEFHYLRAGR